MFVCRVSKIGRGCKIVTTACLFGCFFFGGISPGAWNQRNLQVQKNSPPGQPGHRATVWNPKMNKSVANLHSSLKQGWENQRFGVPIF